MSKAPSSIAIPSHIAQVSLEQGFFTSALDGTLTRLSLALASIFIKTISHVLPRQALKLLCSI